MANIVHMGFLAALPVAIAIALVVLRRSALLSAAVGLVAALAVAMWRFPIPTSTWPSLLATWLPVLAEVLLIIGGGLALARAMQVTERQAELASWLQGALGSGVGAALAVVHGVTPFAESLTGFGIGVTVAIPLLLHLGFDSRRAATIGLLGLCAVPWGSMGPGTLIAATLSGTSFRELGLASALASGPVFLLVGVVAAWVASRPGARVGALAGAVGSGLVLWAAVTAANLLLGTAPAGAVGAIVCLLVQLGFHRFRGARWGSVPWGALSGYGTLLGGVLAATIAVDATGAADGRWRYVASPAVWLFIAVAITTPRRHLRAVLVATGRQWRGAGPVTGAFLLLGVVMAASGMSAALAREVAGIGPTYVLLLPFVAALGGYLTGSNSAANAMFAAPQAQVISLLGLPHLAAMGVHNVASSLLLMGSPAKTELAAQLCPDQVSGRRAAGAVLVTDLVITSCLALTIYFSTLISS